MQVPKAPVVYCLLYKEVLGLLKSDNIVVEGKGQLDLALGRTHRFFKSSKFADFVTEYENLGRSVLIAKARSIVNFSLRDIQRLRANRWTDAISAEAYQSFEENAVADRLQVQKLIESLKPTEQDILYLSLQIEGGEISVKDAAQSLGIPRTTFNSRRESLYAKLRHEKGSSCDAIVNVK